jgi:hypothetical protein
MKARVFSTENQISKAVRAETEKQLNEIYEKALCDAGYQMLATTMIVLHKSFGFGGERLRRLKDLTEEQFYFMQHGVLGQPYTSNDCVKYLKEHYGIDFSESQYKED